MTQLKPSLCLERLLVTKEGKNVYDEVFELGVNIIRGENGSGKSTIADFIFYSLGGDLTAWREAAINCDFTFAQVRVNGEPAILRREVSSQHQRPMSIYWGGLGDATESVTEGWQVFPFSYIHSKESFSQVLFRALGMPEVFRGKSDVRVTMHQILRLLYVDQRTPYDEIFFSEQFDSPVTREAVGDLLLGSYDAQLYEKKIVLREQSKALTDVNTELQGIRLVLGEADTPIEGKLLAEEIRSAKAEREKLTRELETGEGQEDKGGADRVREEALKEVRKRLQDEQAELRRLERELEGLE